MKLVCPACASANCVPAERLADQPVCYRGGAELMAEAVAKISRKVQ